MKIVSNLLQDIEGIQIWYIISLLLFFIMFLVFLARILRKPSGEMKEIKNSIFDDQDKEG
jgi:hypothetical protein